MSGRFVRASAYRHVFGDAAKPDKSFLDIRPSFDGEANHISANDKFFAFSAMGGGGPLIVHRLDAPGRLGGALPRLLIHKGPVLDSDFNPFVANVIATASEDATVKVTLFPTEGLTEDITTATGTLEGHERKVSWVRWHPVANNILASASADNTVRVWDVSSSAEALCFSEFGDAVQSIDWNRNGSMIATTCKDHFVRVLDPRDCKTALKAPGFQGAKASRVVFAGDKVITVGFGKSSERGYAIWDLKNFDKPLAQVEIDRQAGGFIPFFDEDNSILYLGSKGGSNIAYFELTATEPYLHTLSEFRDTQSQKGFCFLPKKACDVSSCEIAMCLRLMSDSVVPISFKVPRKSDLFQKDIFPDTYAGVPGLEAAAWLGGENAEPQTMSLNPKDRASASVTVTEFKAPAKSAAELQRELDAANARIQELEAEVARLKA